MCWGEREETLRTIGAHFSSNLSAEGEAVRLEEDRLSGRSFPERFTRCPGVTGEKRQGTVFQAVGTAWTMAWSGGGIWPR